MRPVLRLSLAQPGALAELQRSSVGWDIALSEAHAFVS